MYSDYQRFTYMCTLVYNLLYFGTICFCICIYLLFNALLIFFHFGTIHVQWSASFFSCVMYDAQI